MAGTPFQASFKEAYDRLNDDQRDAVNRTDGPVLVIAGPGTGKTQLLSTRAAYIVNEGRATAANILCLTYTDAGAIEMRNRLAKIMGPAGSEVAVHTFHGFGRWLIGQYPEAFSETQAQRQLDDLGRHHIFEELLTDLPLRHPLTMHGEAGEFSRQGAVANAIKAFKQAGLEPDSVRAILAANHKDYLQLEPLWSELFDTTLSAKRLPTISETVASYVLKAVPDSYAAIVLASLSDAIITAEAEGVTAKLGNWRDKHLQREGDKLILKAAANHSLLSDLTDLYEAYQKKLLSNGLYDYEDMVLRAIEVFESKQDILLDIAERFFYVMVDEFQDTSGAQNRMLDAIIGAHPTDLPNILAVGDDDQAIMRFQGAELSGMVRFVETYAPKIIVLTKNYRAGQAILDAAAQIIAQTDERLIHELPKLHLTKDLVAKEDAAPATILHQQFISPSAQYQGVADRIHTLLANGETGNSIAVIASKHRELEALSPYLEAAGIAVSYDRRETVLEESHIAQLLDLARSIEILARNPKAAEAFLPTVLSAPYWQLPATAVYDIAIASRLAQTSWLETMLHSKDTGWRPIAEWLIAAAKASQYHNFTQMFDILIGRQELDDTELRTSPFSAYIARDTSEQYVRLLSHLICLRQAVLAARPTASGIQDLLAVCDDYRHSGLKLVDDNPLLRGSNENVQLMSGHSAKGREFKHVILLSSVERVWGPKANGNNTNIPLPENMQIYPTGNNDVDKLRLLYVAITRTKSDLYIASYRQSDDGKPTEMLSFISLGESANGWWQPEILPAPTAETAAKILENTWRAPSTVGARSLKQQLEPVMPAFRISPSVLNNFLNIKYSGPLQTIEGDVLKFPSAYNERSALGSAVHKVLSQAQKLFAAGKPMVQEAILELFNQELDASGLPEVQLKVVRSHGEAFLPNCVASLTHTDFGDIIANEQYVTATLPGTAIPMSGQLDAIKSTTKNRLQILDYKTGKPPLDGWNDKGQTESKRISLHFYRLQLLFYKLLVENSPAYKDQTVQSAELIFVEPVETPDGNKEFVRLRIDDFEQAEMEHIRDLITAVYTAIANGALPDISQYKPTYKDIQRFEQDFLASGQ